MNRLQRLGLVIMFLGQAGYVNNVLYETAHDVDFPVWKLLVCTVMFTGGAITFIMAD